MNLNNKNQYTVLELFAGAGGLALGLEEAGFKTIGLVEIDKYASNTLKTNRPNWQVYNMDIKDFNLKLSDYIHSEIDIISGGFPCQPFSYAGMRLGLQDTRGTIFYEFANIIEKIKPKVILAENVKGLKTHNNGKTLETILQVFNDIGYNVSYQVLNAMDYGVAQKRERMVIIGIRKDLPNSYQYPKPCSKKLVLKDILKNVPLSEGAKYPENKKRIMELVPPGGCWRHLPDEIAKEYMAGSYHLGGGKTGMARRISWNEQSLTLTCSPSQKQTERCHPDETRPFTVREYARIQSFPDSWEFKGSMGIKYKQIGNAVPVNLAKHIGLSILNFLNGNNHMLQKNQYNLHFISDNDLFNHVKETVTKYSFSMNLKKFNKNIIDPVKLTFDKLVYKKDIINLIDSEVIRQMDKSNNNTIGYFHQNIFKYIGGSDWHVPSRGFDVINDSKKIFVEIKNKHNTMNSSSSKSTYIKMSNQVLKNPDATCMLVEIIAKKSQNIPWNITVDKQKCKSEKIRRVSIDKFYEITTGDKNSFKDLCQVLPKVIKDVVASIKEDIFKSTVFDQLQDISDDILTSLYMLTFKKYEGFDKEFRLKDK